MDTDAPAVAVTPHSLMPEMTLEDTRSALEALRREYNTTVRVVAVLTERLLEATGGIMVTVTDQALYGSPDLDAVRNEPRRAVLLRVSR